MQSAGFRLREKRLRIGLTFRDVEQASDILAGAKQNSELFVSISRLAEIENRGVVPSIFKLYSLCVIYKLDFPEVLDWYGLNLDNLSHDQKKYQGREVQNRTHLLASVGDDSEVQIPVRLDPGLSLRKTTYLTRMIEAWGRVPLSWLNRLNLQEFRYGYVGLDDWTMYPLIRPGSLLQIDSQRTEVDQGHENWRNEFERPVYFVELHNGYACAWCSLKDRTLMLHPHPLSPCSPVSFSYPREAEIVGQVVGVAMQMDLARQATRSTEAVLR